MASEILHDILSSRLTLSEFTRWMTVPDTPSEEEKHNYSCSRSDFVLFFINFLRDDTSRILQTSNKGISPGKKQITCAQKDKIDDGSFGKTFNNKQIECSIPIVRNTSYSNSDKHETVKNVGTSLDLSLDSDRDKSGTKIESSNSRRISLNFVGSTSSPCGKKNPLTPSDNNHEVFFVNCPLSPIANESYSNRRNNTSYGSEIHSPTNNSSNKGGRSFTLEDYIVKDSRKSNSSKKKAFFNKSASSLDNTKVDCHNACPTIVNEPVKPNQTSRRRIKPTRLITSENIKSLDNSTALTFGMLSRPVASSAAFTEQSDTTNQGDIRDMLLKERHKRQLFQVSSQQQPPQAEMSISNNTASTCVIPSVQLVSMPDQIALLANVYCCLLDANLIASVMTELYFILSLLVVKETTCDSSELATNNNHGDFKPLHFKSVHECVYFSTLVLNKKKYLLNILDRIALKMLLENVRILDFMPDLWNYLHHLYETQNVEKGNSCKFSTKTSISANAWFQLDTDNRENFPSIEAFNIFRKQRDAFFELLQVWEANHTSPGWTFAVALGSRVNSLLKLHNDPCNFIHLARLFRSQLLGACQVVSSVPENTTLDNSTETVLKCLKEGNPEKFSRLHERLVAPLKCRGQCFPMTFPGQQEFYRDFILQGANAVFNQHLIDSLLNEILVLNATNFSASEVEDSATGVDEDTKENFQTCVNAMQLLAKFLGFVVFLPYRTVSKPSQAITEAQYALRVKQMPQIDILTCLQEAKQAKKLVLTIPWTVQYLAMADNISLQLPYYNQVLKFLCSIYHRLPASTSFSLYGRLLLELSLGWLFELPHFPEGLYYVWCSDQEKAGTNDDTQLAVELCALHAIDGLDIVDIQCLNACCPFLGDLKLLLASGANPGNAGSARHITPVPATFDKSSPSSAAKQLELQLEESFLHGQPGSTRKTVDFVVERVASSCVKKICGSDLPKVKEYGLSEIRSFFDSEQSKKSVLSKAHLEAQRCSTNLRTCCQEIVPAFCEQKCARVVPALLSDDVPQAVAQHCIAIASRWSQEKVNAWIHSHITPALFTKDFQSEVERSLHKTDAVKMSHVVPSGGRNVEHKEDVTSPPKAVTCIRELTWKLMGPDHETVTAQQVLLALNVVQEMACNRCDVIPSAERTLNFLTVDLALALVAHRVDLMTQPVITEFLTLWKLPELSTCGRSDSLMYVISPRNIMLLSQSKEPNATWECLAYLLSCLLHESLLSAQQLEEQCLSLLQQEWSPDILSHLSTCFSAVVNQYRLDNKDTYNDFVLLLELLSELCLDMEDFDFRKLYEASE